MRNYIIHHAPGAQLTFDERQILGRDWNDRIEHGRVPTLRGFARDHGIAFETWRREYERGRMGETVPDPDHPGRRIYALCDAGRAHPLGLSAIWRTAASSGTSRWSRSSRR